MRKTDALFDFFQDAGMELPKQELQQVNGGAQKLISTEMDAGLCDDPDGPEPISDCYMDFWIVDDGC